MIRKRQITIMAAGMLATACMSPGLAQAGDFDLSQRLDALSLQTTRLNANADAQIGLIDTRLDATRGLGPTGNLNTSTFGVNFTGRDSDESASYKSANHLPPEKKRLTKRYAVWAGGTMVVDSNRAKQSGYSTVYTNGMTAGIDARISRSLVVGTSVGTAFDGNTIGSDGSQVASRYVSSMVYASLFSGKQSYFDFGVGGAVADFNALYCGTGNDGSGARLGAQSFAFLRYSRVRQSGASELRPYGQLKLMHADLDGYSEDGADTIDYSGSSANAAQASLGLAGKTSFKTNAGMLSPHADFSLAHTMSRTGTTTIASAGEDGILYQGDPSSSTSETFNLSTGVDWAIDQATSLGVNYGLSSAIRDFTPTQSIAANFKLKF